MSIELTPRVARQSEATIRRRLAHRVVAALPAGVKSVTIQFGRDHSDELACFYRVVLDDAVCGKDMSKALRDVVKPLEELLRVRVDVSDFGYHAYHSYRSESEQREMKVKGKDWREWERSRE